MNLMKRSRTLLLLSLLMFSLLVPRSARADIRLRGFDVYASNIRGHQSSAVYGHYLFLVGKKLAYITLYDLKERKLIYPLKLKAHEETLTPQGIVGGDLYHCNQSNFGPERYAKDDAFPLLYISQRNRPKDGRAFCVALRIQPSYGDKGQIKSFTAEEIQTVYFPALTDSNTMGTPNVAIDLKHKQFVAYCRNTRKLAPDYDMTHIVRYPRPSLRDAQGQLRTEVYLNDSDEISRFPLHTHAMLSQGGCIKGNRLYFFQGAPGKAKIKRPVNLYVVDLKRQKLLLNTNIANLGFDAEPEGCFVYRGHIMTSTNGKRIFRMRF